MMHAVEKLDTMMLSMDQDKAILYPPIDFIITNEFNENHTSTIQANYKVKPIIVSNDAYAKLNIWDTCGNEKFRAITRQYYKDVTFH